MKVVGDVFQERKKRDVGLYSWLSELNSTPVETTTWSALKALYETD